MENVVEFIVEGNSDTLIFLSGHCEASLMWRRLSSTMTDQAIIGLMSCSVNPALDVRGELVCGCNYLQKGQQEVVTSH